VRFNQVELHVGIPSSTTEAAQGNKARSAGVVTGQTQRGKMREFINL
jgi:hypothetical protein